MFLTIIVFSMFVGLLEMMFQYFLQPNMILYPYSVLLSKLSSKSEVLRHLMRPLGRFCNAIWITFYSYNYIFGFDIYVLFAFGMTTFWVEVLGKYVFKEVDSAGKTDAEEGVSYMEWDEESMSMKMRNTPWQSMLWSYLILASFYAVIYIIIPILVF